MLAAARRPRDPRARSTSCPRSARRSTTTRSTCATPAPRRADRRASTRATAGSTASCTAPASSTTSSSATRPPSSFERVFATKVGARRDPRRPRCATTPARRGLLRQRRGVFGNRGQVDYAAANDALDGLARSASAEHRGPRGLASTGARGRGGGMVSRELEREYARRGIGLIELADGVAERSLDELAGPGADTQVIRAGAAIRGALAARPPRRRTHPTAGSPRHRRRRDARADRDRRHGRGVPGAPDLATYWKNIEAGVDAIGDGARDALGSRSSSIPRRTRARPASTASAAASSTPHLRPDPRSASCRSPSSGAEPDQLLALAVAAAAALDDAGARPVAARVASASSSGAAAT